MKKTDYIADLISLLYSSYPESEQKYKDLHSRLTDDLCPPFDRGALLLLSLDLYLLSFESERDKKLIAILHNALLSTYKIKSKDYGKEDFSEFILLCRKKENRQQADRFLCCLHSLMLVISSRV